tara:strand:+ start:4437 stop:4802 length:366 start_codon:yes stop_codon:yes gene_type:complete
MRKNFYKKENLSVNKLQREISSLIRQYTKKATNSKSTSTFSKKVYTGPYLESLLDQIEKKKKLIASYAYMSMVLIPEFDEVGRSKVVGFITYGPAIKHEDAVGKIKYMATYDPPKNRRFAS